AMARNNVIGRDNDIPWHLPADLKQFKQRTMGKPVIMGRRTFESILNALGKPMPGRHSIIISRGDYTYPGVNTHKSLDRALSEAHEYAAQNNCDEIIIGGGGQIYELAMPITTRIYLTVVQQDYEGDAYFPVLDENIWVETARESFDDTPPFIVRTLDRK
ncbi:MAG: dihydrofolate reductase, partial [Alphaproteobacteria bacterium]|nr:dihydrofolate reductase [Alphaproteobacteria bacterium]